MTTTLDAIIRMQPRHSMRGLVLLLLRQQRCVQRSQSNWDTSYRYSFVPPDVTNHRRVFQSCMTNFIHGNDDCIWMPTHRVASPLRQKPNRAILSSSNNIYTIVLTLQQVRPWIQHPHLNRLYRRRCPPTHPRRRPERIGNCPPALKITLRAAW